MTVQLREPERENLHRLIYQAKDEDLGGGDVTGKLLPAGLNICAKFIARQPMVVCGTTMLSGISKAYDELIELGLLVEDGQAIQAGDVIAEWFGPAWSIMAAERIALNFLQRLSGIATLTRKYVETIAGTTAEVFDTRKTTPGWRELEKYAVRVGGGRNHRRGLYDAVLVKDNHLVALANGATPETLAQLGPKLKELRKDLKGGGFVEVEVDTLGQLADAMKLPVDIIMLDNMSPAKLIKAVAMRNQAGLDDKITLEASGGITLKTIRSVAETGVERISVGAVTHSAMAVDIGLDMAIKKG